MEFKNKKFYSTAFLFAAEAGSVEIVKLFLTNPKFDINIQMILR